MIKLLPFMDLWEFPTETDNFSGFCYVVPVNCVGVMGAGLALDCKRKFPSVFREYREDCSAGLVQVGKLRYYKTAEQPKRLICTFPTKDDWRKPSTFSMIELGLEAFAKQLNTPSFRQVIKSVVMPALGCGCGGLDFGLVYSMIEKHMKRCEQDFFIISPKSS